MYQTTRKNILWYCFVRHLRAADDFRINKTLWIDRKFNRAYRFIRIPLRIQVFSNEIRASDTSEKRILPFRIVTYHGRTYFLLYTQYIRGLRCFVNNNAVTALFLSYFKKIYQLQK